jgi:hypothetical protein
MNGRANMPPLKTKPWYPSLFAYKHFEPNSNTDGYPWTALWDRVSKEDVDFHETINFGFSVLTDLRLKN